MRPSKSHPNPGSLKVGSGNKAKWNPADFVFDAKTGRFKIMDRVGRRTFGPFTSTVQAREQGFEFRLDGGALAGRIPTPANAPEPEPASVA